ncbi:gas vesicle protein GvpJ [Promicromonospora sp. MEB111]|uniref:gas vesicle protein GvpJ n=1 Tax=Promicromonospora sp. MEB111 TaxID=3040301 RepID=UPI00254FABA0|nr:gas vesicle protein GvpJ [Promicromonospora sp. MEB111]
MTTVSTRPRSTGYVERPPSSSLADVITIILDKGMVIDAFIRVSVVGIELITIDARIVIASVDTYLRFAEATNRLDLAQSGGRDLPELMEDVSESGAKSKTKGVLSGAKDAIFGKDEDEDADEEQDQDFDQDESQDEEDEVEVPARNREHRRPRRRVSGTRNT